jgi:hypothetical protein
VGLSEYTVPISLALSAGFCWWLSGYDAQVTGEDRRADLKRRAWRCGVTLLLLFVGLGFGQFVWIGVVVPLAVIWAGCMSEFLAGAAHGLIDSPDPRKFEPRKAQRELDKLATLVRQGQRREAIALCARLKKSGEVSALAMEAMLARLDAPGHKVRAETGGRPGQHGVQEKHPSSDEGIESLLVDKKYSRADRQAVRVDKAEGTSAAELLAGGYLGTAIEVLEARLKEQPGDFGAWLSLAEAYGHYCRNPKRAGEIVADMEASARFTSEQISQAQTKLGEWRAAENGFPGAKA